MKCIDLLLLAEFRGSQKGASEQQLLDMSEYVHVAFTGLETVAGLAAGHRKQVSFTILDHNH